MSENSGRTISRETNIATTMVVLWSLMTLTIDAVLIWQVIEQRSSTSYAKTSGVITHSELIKEAEEDTGPYYIADIEYRYRVDEKDYDGDRYRYGPDTEGDKSAQEIVKEYPVGKKVTVYYDRQDPHDAVLSVGLERADLFPVMLAVAFNVAMIALWCWAVWRIRHRFSQPDTEEDEASLDPYRAFNSP
jgi:hypothetical protein